MSVTPLHSRLYVGEVGHRRLSPFAHGFRYRVFSLLLDLSERQQLAERFRLFSHNRFNLFSFHDRDHGDGALPLEKWVHHTLGNADSALASIEWGRIELLCFPRILGYVFNPLAIYYCYDSQGVLRAVIHQVSNTFGERHCYVLHADGERALGSHAADKCFHVSPFFDRQGDYRFRLTRPSERLLVAICYGADEGARMTATLRGRAEPLSDQALARRFLTHPLMTLKVIAAIHFEALRLVAKGARYHRRPAQGAAISKARPLA